MSKVLVSETNLTAIADAIRTKKGSEDTYKPGEMAAAINSITTGGGGEGSLPEAALTIDGDCQYRFYGGGWDWFLENYGSQATCGNNITSTEYMFQNCNLSEIPLELKAIKNTTAHGMFSGCQNLTKAPTLIGTLRTNNKARGMFDGCNKLKTFPRYFFSYVTSTDVDAGYLFNNCHSLEELPDNLFTIVDEYKPDGVKVTAPAITYIKDAVYMFANCYKLRKIENLPAYGRTTLTNYNCFNNAFLCCYMLDTFTFATITTQTNNLVNQTIDLTTVGCVSTLNSDKFEYSKKVYNDSSYQEKKGMVDWWTDYPEYSRYNKQSAIKTINSLPQMKVGYTSTIKFKGEAGSKSGGAINTMTEEQIAVATSKGWTVSFV